MTRRILAFVTVVATYIGVSWGTGFAAWTSNASSGAGSAKALTMPTGATPTAPATSTGSVTLTWSVATLGGTDLTSYTVRRYPAAGGTGTVITCASQTITNRVVSCTYTETAAGSYQFTNTPLRANWVGGESAKSGTTVVSLSRTFAVSTPAGNRTAGTPFTVTLTAMSGANVDTSYTGQHTIAFTGPNNAPSGQAPTGSVVVTFANGVGSADFTAYKAETVTLTATEATPQRTGSTSITVVAGAQKQLAFSVACPTGTMAQSATWTTAVDILDQWKNPTTQGSTAASIGLTSSTSGNGSLSTASVTVAAGANPARSGTFTYTADSGKNKATTITASLTGLTSASCPVTT